MQSNAGMANRQGDVELRLAQFSAPRQNFGFAGLEKLAFSTPNTWIWTRDSTRDGETRMWLCQRDSYLIFGRTTQPQTQKTNPLSPISWRHRVIGKTIWWTGHKGLYFQFPSTQ